ncbi:MAG: DNA polymerase III subunit alpha [Lentimicrobiaceae bacterium]|nr:DNA polymerase III subunit alpha [Lentimicrobiaceae bacterium]
MLDYTHLHVHSQFSILDGAAKIDGLLARAGEMGMDALALTDHGNLFGLLKFYNAAKEKYKIKPILGCEIYVARRTRADKASRVDRSGYHLILLAKNTQGYRNLSKLSSLGYRRENFYYTPRIDKPLLRQYHEGLIASSACLGGEIPSTILLHGEERAATVLEEYLDIFGEDFYLEMQNHGLKEQEQVNKSLLNLSARYGVKLIATNDVHFIHREDHEAHRILICLNTGKEMETEEGMHYTGQEFLKSSDEMALLFPGMPEVLTNTREIVDKVEDYHITTDTVIVPHFPLPEEFASEYDYLRYLTYEGAAKRYPEITPDIRERLDYELDEINREGFSGYFLIVQDFINAARKMGVVVGPGRGSAAGSAVAYCTGITNIDPIRYNLLFERFLNPERVTMPDIDVDFDDAGRDSVMKYVVDKYGEERVAQIITFGTMAARSAIRDVGRVLKVPLEDVDKIAKLVPEKPGVTLMKAFKDVPELADLKKNGPENIRRMLTFAEILEGSNRHTSTHACGVIIGPDSLIEHVPLAIAKDSAMMVTQYEGKLVEKVGMLKMDFLGLKTLSIVKDAIELIRKRHGIQIDIDHLPLDDPKTFDLYQRGDTIATFQFESDGMRAYLKELKPSNLEDLIAMNALHRPGPIQFIPSFINRKHNREKVEFLDPLLEDILKPTYGIMVYQEQIMQVAQRMGGFTLGKADILRRAMGKKEKAEMEKQRADFLQGARNKGISEPKAIEVFNIMLDFANYGFNRSHSAAYSLIAYQTAYLKANYPPEYMAAVLTHNLSDIKKITFFIDECRRQKIDVLGPDINESELNFTVNKAGAIRFGMAAIKGIGEAAVESIIEERDRNGPITDIFDLARRINSRTVNKRSLEALAMAGAFDSFRNSHRAQYFYKEPGEETNFLEKVLRHAVNYQNRQMESQASLFGDEVMTQLPDIQLPDCEPWTQLIKINFEKEVTGFYISGHPLDDFRLEMDNLCTITLAELQQDPGAVRGRDLTIGGMVTEVKQGTTQKGNPMGSFMIEDFTDTYRMVLFSEEFLRFRHLLISGTAVLIKAKVLPRYNSDSQLELKIFNMMLLSEAIEKLVREITVRLQLSAVQPPLTELILKFVKKMKGKCVLKFIVSDPEENLSVEMLTGKYHVPCKEFLQTIKDIPGISYKLA